MAPNLGVSTSHFALIAPIHNLPCPWNDIVEKENMNNISFDPVDKTMKWNEVNKPVKHCIKIISKKKKTWNDLNSAQSTSLFNVDKKKRADNIQSSSINLSVLPKEKPIIERSLSLYSNTLSYTPKKRNYNQMNISELSLSFNNNTTRKQWNDVCDLYANDNFCVKKSNPRQSERSVEHIQKFTVKSVSMNHHCNRANSLEKNEISPCQEISLQTNQIERRKWNDICDQFPNENFCVKKSIKQRPENERSIQQIFTVKSISPIELSTKKNQITQCQEFSLQHDH